MTVPNDIRLKKRPFPYRGPNSSADKDSFDEVYYDLNNLRDSLEELYNKHTVFEAIFAREYAFTRNLVSAKDAEDQMVMDISDSSSAVLPFSFYKTDGVSYNGDIERHGSHMPMLGTIYPPKNNVLNYFYQKGNLDSQLIVSREPTTVVTDGATYSDATIAESSTINMFNGNNQSYWYRKYTFQASNDISSVSTTIDITVPAVFGIDSNFLMVIPFPGLGLTINSIYDGNADHMIDSSTIENAGPIAFNVQAGTTQLRLNVTQSNFVEENGLKTFYIGFQEIDLQYVAWDTTPISVPPDTTTDNHVIVTFEPPLNKQIESVDNVRIDGECERIDIYGYVSGVQDAQTTTITRAQMSTDTVINTALTFNNLVDSVQLVCYLTADSTIDYLKGIALDTSVS